MYLHCQLDAWWAASCNSPLKLCKYINESSSAAAATATAAITAQYTAQHTPRISFVRHFSLSLCGTRVFLYSRPRRAAFEVSWKRFGFGFGFVFYVLQMCTLPMHISAAWPTDSHTHKNKRTHTHTHTHLCMRTLTRTHTTLGSAAHQCISVFVCVYKCVWQHTTSTVVRDKVRLVRCSAYCAQMRCERCRVSI